MGKEWGDVLAVGFGHAVIPSLLGTFLDCGEGVAGLAGVEEGHCLFGAWLGFKGSALERQR